MSAFFLGKEIYVKKLPTSIKKQCKVSNCDRFAQQKGLCSIHRHRTTFEADNKYRTDGDRSKKTHCRVK
jgi:hypothetical protein